MKNTNFDEKGNKVRKAKDFWTRLSLCFVLIVTTALSACAQEEAEESLLLTNTYLQTEVAFPESGQYIMSLEKTDSGKLWMLGVDNITTGISLWELGENNSWEELINITELLEVSNTDMLVASPISKNEKVLCAFIDILNTQEGLRFYLIDMNQESGFQELKINTGQLLGELSPEDFDNFITGIYPIMGDQYIIQENTGSIYVLDSDMETITPVPKADDGSTPQFLSVAELDGNIYVLSEGNGADDHSLVLRTLNLLTGVFSGLQDDISEEFVALFAEHNNYSHFSVMPRIEGDTGQANRLIICVSNGIYEYTNDAIKKIADPNGTVLSDPNKTVLGCLFYNQNDFFLMCWNSDGRDTPYSLYKYEKTSNSPTHSSQLRVYTLQDNAGVRQAVTLFEETYPDTEVILEIGLSSEGITTDDALKNLNVEILAGGGPDILFLDGLPIEYFLDQRVLHDLTNIYNEAIASDLYYENILNAFVREGECRILPMRFTFPAIINSHDVDTSRIDSLPSFLSSSREESNRNPETALFCNMAILDDLFIAYYPEIIDQGELNEDALREFFISVESLSLILEKSNNQRSVYPEQNREYSYNTKGQFDNHAFGIYSFYNNPNQIFVNQFLSEIEIANAEVMLSSIGNNARIEALDLSQRDCFAPRFCVAVSNNSKEIELSEAFIRIMLEEDYQFKNHNDGLSINKHYFSDKIAKTTFSIGLGEGDDLIGGPFSHEIVDYYESLFSTLSTPVVVDDVIQTAVYEELRRCLNGEAPLEETYNSCKKKIHLYLAE